MEVADFRRLNYFYGQLLSAQDFQDEQSYFREKMKLHNRCLHGFGTVCGLLVEPVPMPKECPTDDDKKEQEVREKLKELLEEKQRIALSQKTQPQSPAGVEVPAVSAAPGAPTPAAPAAQPQAAAVNPLDGLETKLDADIAALQKELGDFYKTKCKKEPRTQICITPGLAIDCKGNELVLRKSVTFDLLERLSNEDYNRVRKSVSTLYISLCYCEEPVDPVRPVLPDACGAKPECEFSKTRDGLRIEVTTTPPALDHRCDTCCECCADECLLIARIECFIPGEPLHESHIHNEVRRPLGTYDATSISGISWKHGHTYTQEEAGRILGTDLDEEGSHRGLEIRFSRPVRASTIHRGVLDIWVIEGGRGRAGEIYHKSGEFVHKPKDGYVDRIHFRDTTRETLEPGDRVLIIFRADFVLDRCCRPIDGEHVGGRVPLLPEYEHSHHEEHHDEDQHGGHHHSNECCSPAQRPGPWTSGNGTPGGTFESWFYVREDEKEYKKAR